MPRIIPGSARGRLPYGTRRFAMVRRIRLGIFPSAAGALRASRKETCTVLPRVSAPHGWHQGGGTGKPQVSLLGLWGVVQRRFPLL